MSDKKEQPFFETNIITLNHGEHQDSTIYRFEKGSYIQFCPGPSLMGKKIFLYTNYVLSDKSENEDKDSAEFVRNQYSSLQWRRDLSHCNLEDADAEETELGTGALCTDIDMYCEIRLKRAGTFHFYWVYETADAAAGPQGSGWFHVLPTLRPAPGRDPILLDAIACQTLLTRCIGPLTRWEGVLKVAREAGYNMVHLTPVQFRGGSGSSYSIADQLRLDPGIKASWADLENLLSKVRAEWGMLSVSDIVLNHTANETPWLGEHPEATYNCFNCPHLRPAALLDAALARLGNEVARGDLATVGVPRRITSHEHIDALRYAALQKLPTARLHDLFICDAEKIVQQFHCLARNKVPAPGEKSAKIAGELQLIPDPQYRRLSTTIDMDLALQIYNVYRTDCFDEETRLKRCCEELKRKLDQLNEQASEQFNQHIVAAVDNCLAGVRYYRLQADGPRVEEINAKHPLFSNYFTWPSSIENLSAAEAEAIVYGDKGALVMAHNGWVMGSDPLQDFAAREQNGRVYLRRELIAWGDSVKLRYGNCPEDNPWLWKHMKEYVEQTAEVFDGVRLDNCHSTPLHVAEYMLDAARSVRPDLYILAELFTNSDHVDNIYVNRLGLTSLVREALSAWDSHEQGRLVHRFGGRPAGAFLTAGKSPAKSCVAHALLMDLTHDNPAPAEKRCVIDMLPSAALVAVACCASGSTRGYDELVPHHIHVVDEVRLYPEWNDKEMEGEGSVSAVTGMIRAKRVLNELHSDLAVNGYSEVFVDQMDSDVVAVTRHNPRTRQSVVLVASTAFGAPPAEGCVRHVGPLKLQGELGPSLLLEMSIKHKDHRQGRPFAHFQSFRKNETYINGLNEYEVTVRTDVPVNNGEWFNSIRREGGDTVIELRGLPPGVVFAVRISPPASAVASINTLHQLARELRDPRADVLRIEHAIKDLALVDYSHILYRCEAEEREISGGVRGVYEVPGYGPLVYAGLQGAASLFSKLRANDDLGHPLADNLRAGDWLLDFAIVRLDQSQLQPLQHIYKDVFACVRSLPRFLVPAYAELCWRALHTGVIRGALRNLHARVRRGTAWRALALTSFQLLSSTPSAPLPPPAPAKSPSLSAGLPHFSTGYMRCWGRDTFVALPGLLLATGRYADARNHIVAFASTLRHGLIPNLLDGGKNARYNCRDAVWWWLYAIQQYCNEVPNGVSILKESIPRLFPSDDAIGGASNAEQPLHDVMQEALDRHFQGIAFRERNAGRQLDAHMTDKGFQVQAGIDPDTGFPFGGNEHNCGTWMDKMGSSEKAGNRGQPASPRDGSAVELVALAYSAVRWLADLHRANNYPHGGVVRKHNDGTLTQWTFAQWAERIHRCFETHFWIPPQPSAKYTAESRTDLINRRSIYKDTHGATRAWADYQLRCNFSVAMAVAPGLFHPKHAWAALDVVEKELLGPLGMKTLDPADWNYRPDYRNDDDSTDKTVAHGYNYHQGPEWLWPMPFYLRARLAFARQMNVRAAPDVYARLAPLIREVLASPWRGLPELTNAGGAPCADSCLTQAWSNGAVLDVLSALAESRKARPLSAD